MKERPILFSAPMVRAILAGTKTQTRRALRDQNPIDLGASMHGAHLVRRPVFDKVANAVIGHRMAPVLCPYGKPGDRLWVREAWRILGDSPDDTLDMFDRDDVQYRADDDQSYIDKYRPSIHMPRRFSRITLEVAGVRVERLQDISEADAIAEGIGRYDNGTFGLDDPGACMGTTAAVAYHRLWEHINGAGSWEANPFVWVIEFRRI